MSPQSERITDELVYLFEEGKSPEDVVSLMSEAWTEYIRRRNMRGIAQLDKLQGAMREITVRPL